MGVRFNNRGTFRMHFYSRSTKILGILADTRETFCLNGLTGI
jgi:hypothetical protein